MWDVVSVLGGCINSFRSHILWDSHEESYEKLMCIVFITACFDNKMTICLSSFAVSKGN